MFLFQPLKWSPDMSFFKWQLESEMMRPSPTTLSTLCQLEWPLLWFLHLGLVSLLFSSTTTWWVVNIIRIKVKLFISFSSTPGRSWSLTKKTPQHLEKRTPSTLISTFRSLTTPKYLESDVSMLGRECGCYQDEHEHSQILIIERLYYKWFVFFIYTQVRYINKTFL